MRVASKPTISFRTQTGLRVGLQQYLHRLQQNGRMGKSHDACENALRINPEFERATNNLNWAKSSLQGVVDNHHFLRQLIDDIRNPYSKKCFRNLQKQLPQ